MGNLQRNSSWLSMPVLVLFALHAFLAATLAFAEIEVPSLRTRVTDITSTLSSQQQATLEQTIAAFEKRNGSQIAVLLVPTTQPETVEQYAVRVFEQWKLGRKGVDDGVLLLIAKNDRKLRIEVGYGLEGVLTDATAKRIIADDITPRFKQGDFYGGVSAGMERLINVIDSEKSPTNTATPASTAIESNSLPPGSRDPRDVSFSQGFGVFLSVVFVLFVLTRILGECLGGVIAGVIAGVVAWKMSGDMQMGLGVAAGLSAFFIFLATSSSSGGGGGGGGFSSGGGGGSSVGGFSGGGGSSGGGGASGSW
jgi:uncharacterized protein